MIFFLCYQNYFIFYEVNNICVNYIDVVIINILNLIMDEISPE